MLLELHSHLEGTIKPSLVRRIAERNSVKLSEGLFTPQGDYAWDDFVTFLQAYDEASSCLMYSKDYRDITYDYLKSCALEGVIYAETFISPDHAAEMGMSYEDVLSGCAQGIDDAETDFGIVGRIIVTCVRHLGPQQALRIVQQMVNQPHPCVVGFGMGGDESKYVLSDFTATFQIAIDAGYPCTVHAGEVSGLYPKKYLNDRKMRYIGEHHNELFKEGKYVPLVTDFTSEIDTSFLHKVELLKFYLEP